VSGKSYKAKKKGAGRFVQLHQWFMATEAWATLKPGPRALYIELKRRFNGANNGEIYLSHRDAAKTLNVSRNTATGYFSELEERGFIRMTQAPHLGPSGIGLASRWAIEEEPTSDGKPARKSFAAWRQKQNPRPKTGTPRPKNWDTTRELDPSEGLTVPEIGTHPVH
jgi:DNA-binding transcriptional MocR family regulator